MQLKKKGKEETEDFIDDAGVKMEEGELQENYAAEGSVENVEEIFDFEQEQEQEKEKEEVYMPGEGDDENVMDTENNDGHRRKDKKSIFST